MWWSPPNPYPWGWHSRKGRGIWGVGCRGEGWVGQNAQESCGYSNQSYWAVLSCGTVYYAVQSGSNFWVCGWNPKVTIQMKATEQYFSVVLFIMLYKVILTLKYVDESWNVTIHFKTTEQYFPVVLFIMLYKVVLTFETGWNPTMWPFKYKLLSSTFLWCYLFFSQLQNKIWIFGHSW